MAALTFGGFEVVRFFFFSSRRRHTRCGRDWSSDVCSSDLFPDGTDPVGHFILLNNIPFLITGVMEAKGATPWGSDNDDVVFVPLSTGSLRLFEIGRASCRERV